MAQAMEHHYSNAAIFFGERHVAPVALPLTTAHGGHDQTEGRVGSRVGCHGLLDGGKQRKQ